MLKATCSLWQWDDVEKQPWLIGLRKAHPTSSNSEKAPESPVRDETFHSTMCFIFSNFLHLGRFWQAKNHSNLPVSAATSPAVKHLSTKCSQRYSSDSLETGQFFDPLITSRALWNLHIPGLLLSPPLSQSAQYFARRCPPLSTQNGHSTTLLCWRKDKWYGLNSLCAPLHQDRNELFLAYLKEINFFPRSFLSLVFYDV